MRAMLEHIARNRSSPLMPDQHLGARTAGYHHYKIKHLPLK
jgi:hypothetical protein